MTNQNEFEKAGLKYKKQSPVVSIWMMLMEYKKWWMIPIVVMLFLLGVLIFLSGSAAAPFIYTLF